MSVKTVRRHNRSVVLRNFVFLEAEKGCLTLFVATFGVYVVEEGRLGWPSVGQKPWEHQYVTFKVLGIHFRVICFYLLKHIWHEGIGWVDD